VVISGYKWLWVVMGGQVRMVVVQNRKRWLALESSPHGLLRIAVDRGRSDCRNRSIAMRARPKLHKKIGSFVRASSSAQAPGPQARAVLCAALQR